MERPSRVTLWGSDAAALVSSLVDHTGAVGVDASAEPFPVGHGARATAWLQRSPTAVLLLTATELGVRELRTLRSTRAACLTSFANGVKLGQALVCAIASEAVPIPGFALYGAPTLRDRVVASAEDNGLPLVWVDDTRVPDAPVALAAQADLPVDAWDDPLDLSDFNVATLAADGTAERLILDDTAVVDLEPLTTWPRLTSVSLRGLIPVSIQPLLHLTDVTLRCPDSVGLAVLASSTALRRLTLADGALRDLTSLSGLSDLVSLELDGVEIASLQGIEALEGLRRLVVRGASATLDWAGIGRLPHLRELRVSARGHFDVASLPSLPDLDCLEIAGHDGLAMTLEMPGRLTRFGALTQLGLCATDVVDIGFLTDLSHLRRLDLTATDLVDARPLAALPDLVELSLDATRVLDLEPLAQAAALEALDADAEGVTAIGPIAELPSLQRLSVGGACEDLNRLERSSIEELNAWFNRHVDLAVLQALPPLRVARLAGTAVDDLTPLSDWPLETLDLSNTEVTDLTPLAECRDLQRLAVRSRPVCLAPLSRLPLRALDLHRAQVTRFDAIEGSELQELTWSWATFDAPPRLSTLAHLRELDVTMTQLASFASLTGLSRLRRLRAGYLPRKPCAGPLLALPPLAQLVLDRPVAHPFHDALASRHRLFLTGE